MPRQLKLLETEKLSVADGSTQPLFENWAYNLPDEVAYNARRKKEGLFKLTDAEKEAWEQYQQEQQKND